MRPQALSVEGIQAHHILPSELEAAPPLAQVLDEMEQRIGQDVLILHFSSIDLSFLRQSYKTLGRPWPKPLVVDTAVLLARLNERKRWLEPHSQPYPGALGAARATFGLPGHLEHHALWDALATAELFLVLRHRLQAHTLHQLI